MVAEVYAIGALKRFSDRYLDMDHMRTEEISLTWHHCLAQTAGEKERVHTYREVTEVIVNASRKISNRLYNKC